MSAIYKVTIDVTRDEEVVTGKQWVKGGTESKDSPGEYGYTPQTVQTKSVEHRVFSYEAKTLQVAEVVRAVLANSAPLTE